MSHADAECRAGNAFDAVCPSCRDRWCFRPDDTMRLPAQPNSSACERQKANVPLFESMSDLGNAYALKRARPRHRAIVCTLGVCLLCTAIIDTASAADLAGCNGDLAQMQSDRRDIAARSSDVSSAIEQFEICTRQATPSTAASDPCRGQADVYQKTVARLNAALDAADARMRRVATTCAPVPAAGQAAAAAPPRVNPEPLPAPAAPPRAAQETPAPAAAAPARATLTPPPGTDAQCDLARSYKHKIPFDGVMRICQRSMSEADCKICLGPEDN
jgi:hypothetical protein